MADLEELLQKRKEREEKIRALMEKKATPETGTSFDKGALHMDGVEVEKISAEDLRQRNIENSKMTRSDYVARQKDLWQKKADRKKEAKEKAKMAKREARYQAKEEAKRIKAEEKNLAKIERDKNRLSPEEFKEKARLSERDRRLSETVMEQGYEGKRTAPGVSRTNIIDESGRGVYPGKPVLNSMLTKEARDAGQLSKRGSRDFMGILSEAEHTAKRAAKAVAEKARYAKKIGKPLLGALPFAAAGAAMLSGDFAEAGTMLAEDVYSPFGALDTEKLGEGSDEPNRFEYDAKARRRENEEWNMDATLETIAPGLRDMEDEKKRYNNYSLYSGGNEREEREMDAGIFNRYEGAM